MSDAKILLLASKDQFSDCSAWVFDSDPLFLLHADTLENALVTARQERPELVLLVAGLPGLDAIGGCAAFKQDEGLCAIPVVVFVSGNEAEAESFRKAGCDDCLPLPMDRKGFLSCLHKFVPGMELPQERVPFYSRVTIRDEGDVFYGMTGDISGGGLFVAAFDKLPEQGDLQLSFTLPDDKTTTVKTVGRVAWLNSKENAVSTLPEGFGVEFTSISREEYLAIKEFIAAARKKNQP